MLLTTENDRVAKPWVCYTLFSWEHLFREHLLRPSYSFLDCFASFSTLFCLFFSIKVGEPATAPVSFTGVWNAIEAVGFQMNAWTVESQRRNGSLEPKTKMDTDDDDFMMMLVMPMMCDAIILI